MAEYKKGFILYCDLLPMVEKFLLQDRINKTNYAGELFYHILLYVNDQSPMPIDFIIDVAFEPIKQQLKRDLEKYEVKRTKNKESANKRWQKEDANACERIIGNAKHAVKDTVNDTVNDIVKVTVKDITTVIAETELTDTEIEYQITQMIVPNILKVWKEKNPRYFSHLETDSHAALQIAYNIAAAKGWKKAHILKYKEAECIESFTKISIYIMSDKFWSSKTLEQIAKPNNWQKIINEMVERTQDAIPSVFTQEKPKYNIDQQLQKYG